MRQIKDLKKEEISAFSEKVFELVKFAGDEFNLHPLAISELLVKAAETMTEVYEQYVIHSFTMSIKMSEAKKKGTKFPRA